MIDWSRVAHLKEEVGAEDFDEIIALFLEETQEVIDRLSDAPDLTELEADLHFLKGSALTLGFTTFSTLCQAGETDAAIGKGAQVDLSEILDSYAASKEAFLTNRQQNCAA